MNAKELLSKQIDDAGYQLTQALNGMSETAMDSKATPQSPREIVAHLCECYEAAIAQSEGREHEWGSYDAGDKSTPILLGNFQALRERAVEKVLAGDDAAIWHGHQFIVAHDYYHIGQLCAARVADDPSWDTYAIYRN